MPALDGETNPLHLEHSWPSYVVAIRGTVSFVASFKRTGLSVSANCSLQALHYTGSDIGRVGSRELRADISGLTK